MGKQADLLLTGRDRGEIKEAIKYRLQRLILACKCPVDAMDLVCCALRSVPNELLEAHQILVDSGMIVSGVSDMIKVACYINTDYLLLMKFRTLNNHKLSLLEAKTHPKVGMHLSEPYEVAVIQGGDIKVHLPLIDAGFFKSAVGTSNFVKFIQWARDATLISSQIFEARSVLGAAVGACNTVLQLERVAPELLGLCDRVKLQAKAARLSDNKAKMNPTMALLDYQRVRNAMTTFAKASMINEPTPQEIVDLRFSRYEWGIIKQVDASVCRT